MSESNSRIKLLPRNVAALRRGQNAQEATQVTAGNPTTTRLESGVGNCFPGLECDLRNLERRFFPFLECNISDTSLSVVAVDWIEAQAARTANQITVIQFRIYQKIASTLLVLADGNSNWNVSTISGDFGPLGNLSNLQLNLLTPPSSGAGRHPPDIWTAIRLLKENSDVTLSLAGPTPFRITGKRARYLDDNGALAAMFLPGELTQSLCSPWTHDFRDCACYYWASNHPDIVQPELPLTAAASDPNWNAFVDWERSNRSQNTPPPSSTIDGPTARQMGHYDINNRWQQLHIVINGRELTGAIEPEKVSGKAFVTDAELIKNLRFAAGIELGVMHEYLCAAFSLIQLPIADIQLSRAVQAAHAEIMRIALGEMRHLRVVNEVLAQLTVPPFQPALQVSSKIPVLGPAKFRDRQFRPLTAQALKDFIEVETAAHSIDVLYSNIQATFLDRGNEQLAQVIGSIIADGEDHLETFEFIKQWVAPFGTTILRTESLAPPPATNPLHRKLQLAYGQLLDGLFQSYSAGLPAGATQINTARQLMVQPGGINDLALAIADAGFLVVFDDPTDPRFVPILPPQP